VIQDSNPGVAVGPGYCAADGYRDSASRPPSARDNRRRGGDALLARTWPQMNCLRQGRPSRGRKMYRPRTPLTPLFLDGPSDPYRQGRPPVDRIPFKLAHDVPGWLVCAVDCRHKLNGNALRTYMARKSDSRVRRRSSPSRGAVRTRETSNVLIADCVHGRSQALQASPEPAAKLKPSHPWAKPMKERQQPSRSTNSHQHRNDDSSRRQRGM